MSNIPTSTWVVTAISVHKKNGGDFDCFECDKGMPSLLGMTICDVIYRLEDELGWNVKVDIVDDKEMLLWGNEDNNTFGSQEGVDKWVNGFNTLAKFLGIEEIKAESRIVRSSCRIVLKIV